MYNKTNFQKPSITVDKQLELLKERGLIFNDFNSAKHYLDTVSYYRLSAYFKPFQFQKANEHYFLPEITFENIWNLYVFDRELRLIISDALERIEITLRTALSNVLSLRYGNLWYLSESLFSDNWLKPNEKTGESPFNYFKREVGDVCRQRKEEFIKHYFSKYNEPAYPPSWMLIECLSFGKCTSLFRNLKKLADKKAVCEVFEFHPRVIESCLEPLRYIRNLCAHHSRLWNRWFVFTPKHIQAFITETKSHSLHEQLLMIHKLHQLISPKSLWQERLYDLFNRYEENIQFSLMGFKTDWRNDPLWDF